MADPKDLAQMSVQDRALLSFRRESPIVFRIAAVADGIPSIGSEYRDSALWDFWPTEPMLAGAVYSMCAKVAALDFKLRGPRRLVHKYKRRLLAADFGIGNGWVNFIYKVTQDLLTSDQGAFIELLRPQGAGPTTQVHGLAHLDSHRCSRTGNVLQPVTYTRENRADKKLKWYEVIPLADMPSPREERNGAGLCAVSRVLRAAQTLRDVGIYKRQKLAGKRTPAIMAVQGMTRDQIIRSLDEAIEEQLTEGYSHYTSPVIMATMDAQTPLDIKMVELAGLPDGYNEDDTLKWYIASLALAFGTDYTEFAPLPGGNLGSATQATEMAARARGKGPGATLQQLELALNYWVLPEGVEFQFASSDPIAEQQRIEHRRLRAQERKLRIDSGELTVEQALRLAVDEGDAPESFLEPESDEIESHIDMFIKSAETLEERAERVQGSIEDLRKRLCR